ncbi:MAG: helix-turn-helix transcriptional regulator [Candidatus Cyclobacteriaceae bacterium M3_2C_046]
MSEISFSSYSFHHLLDQLQKKLQKQSNIDGGEHTFVLPESWGKGQISLTHFGNNGLSLWKMEMKSENELRLKFKPNGYQPLRFIFCHEGDLDINIQPETLNFDLSPMMNLWLVTNGKNQEIVHLKPEQSLKVVIVDLDRQVFFNQNLSDEFSEFSKTLSSDVFKNNFFHLSHYNLAIAEIIEQVHNLDYKGIVRHIYMHSKILEIVALVMRDYEEEKQYGDKRVKMKQEDLDIIVRARRVLQSNLKNPPTIRELAREVGINENKLKSGYKQVYNTTINESLTRARLEQSKMLLAQQKHSIREISLEIGYKSPSHFSRQFKKRFGVLPKDFLKTIKSAIPDLMQ